MKTPLVLVALVFASQAHGFGTGQMVSAKGKTTKVCQDCINFFTDIQQILSSLNTTAEIEQLVDQMVCSQMGSLESMCKDLVKQYVPLVLQTLAGMEDPKELCGYLRMCSEEALNFFSKEMIKKQGGEECDLCKDAINELKDLVRNKEMQTSVKDFLENRVCPLFGSLASECKQEVETYAQIIFELLENELDATAVCETFGLCSKARTMSLSRVGLSSVNKIKVMKADKKVDASVECIMCELALRELDQLIGDNRTEANIIAALDKLCSVLPSTVKDECTSFVNTYGPAVLALLLQELQPDQICTTLGLCSQRIVLKHSVDASVECVLCEFVLQEVDILISQNKSQSAVESALKKVCDLMPVTISAECRQFVDSYGPAIINLIVNELDPKAVCKTLRLCKTDQFMKVKVPVMKPMGKVSASAQCVVCEFVMKELDTLIADNSTQEEIKAALDKVCSLLPDTVRQDCVNLVNQYSVVILELLVQELDPKMICRSLGLCSQSSINVKQRLTNDDCEMCKFVLNYVETLLKENATVQEIKEVLDKVCNFLPSAMSAQCNAFVNEYAALVVNLIVQDMDPTQICTMIGLCKNSTHTATHKADTHLRYEPRVLGRNKCTFGPAYWCSSKENAVRCEAVEHCRRHVWKN